MGDLIKGKPVADAITTEVKKEAEALREKGIMPKLKIVRVGEREDDLAYERAAVKRMNACSIECDVLSLPADISQADFSEELEKVNNDESVHGILLFRPLPKQLNENEIKYIISAEKDIDCMNPINVAKVTEGDESGFAPCTPSAAIEILKYYKVELKGKEAVVLGRSMVVGKPLSMLLLKENATVTICHSKTASLSEMSSRADILVAAIGKSKMVTPDYIKEGATVIDVGINVDGEGKITGDVNTSDCIEKAGLITPVPAGVGSVTTAVLAKNVVKACKLNIGGNI
ncbi:MULTISPECIES: bifunctional 5,10-methylenetetrahydrofolate dehydrogenase/5,10-methenyltetrahydrofolate cyclohydrolase [unclassified Sedimentibacter]|uniref:bifunctional 5,10-methylenetetrahydrofolate dehydrogenase/5,10-methenyltetrahydrofolate cyclohydrolase n=1 Tax=unclassified Sedimentibacter TaxID=2649220 RepID=UPI0027E043CF|nr:bifunctional 5,10-methylenetetrahydrofolate dehydrogenase/5,10-methenyltetrahydrofolate cyclohydrolase [Sedimentibacter sp. MB35-C1]WMJ77373.1 bifunctional 5,10-methylenetetrahydrofolate dehydrogenase/5,10-methenyltetrahydrofolate cyclohydrolase [Sedimentibacter sp. MB35-C1]